MARRRSAGLPWLGLAWGGAALGMEAMEVVSLRLAKLAAGGPMAQMEAARMMTEKLAAMSEAQLLMLGAMAGGRKGLGARSVLGLYQRKVRANRRRLGRSG